jgi:preprotein translocase subunit SecD
MKFDLIKNWRILLVIAAVLISLYIISPSFSQRGVIVTSVATDSPLFGKVQAGESITWANEKSINSPEDLYEFENFTGTFRFLHSGKLDLVSIEQPGLGLSTSKASSSNLQFGMDMVGGTRVLLKPKGVVTDAVIQQIISTLETRINVFGLKEAKFQPVKDVSGNFYVQIEMAGGSKEEIENLLAKQGYFEGKIPRIITFANNTGKLNLVSTYDVHLNNDSIEINDTVLRINESSKIENMPFMLTNLTNNSAVIYFTVFTGNDIQSVCLQDQPGICVSRVTMVQGGYEFNFQVFITKKGAENFATVTKDMKIITDSNTGDKYLDSKISLFLDENLITELSISSDLRGQAYTTPAITGFRQTRDDAVKEQLMLKSILQSGSLPTSLEIIRADQISPTLGQEFFRSAIIAAIIAEITVAGVIYLRYRHAKILLQMMTWSVSELIITLGAAALIKQAIDLSAIAGLIAAIGTGTNDQIIMIDEMLIGGTEKSIYTLKQRVKRSFFIIFGAAGTVFAAMLPMIFIGVGVMRGFAIVTTIGILIGVFITRPAFPIIAERLLGEKVKQGNEKKESKVEGSIERKIESEAKRENISKEDVIKEEWKRLMNMASKELYGKPFNDLTHEQKEEVKRITSEAEKKETS